MRTNKINKITGYMEDFLSIIESIAELPGTILLNIFNINLYFYLNFFIKF
jgi:hypothetical protein